MPEPAKRRWLQWVAMVIAILFGLWVLWNWIGPLILPWEIQAN